ncbi:MAG: imidazole glycerol phosphate synthase subunit HisH [Candidatus Diapherotrites archaeon CG08_land_8_20_14_0_20_34_12]|nr:MAG: imidazole glycerol phosphate synthase subunit HisH [Candidatus Diapherotrites archaeon CG08_land_8_20_14_0_20_34_12]
MIGIMDYGIGNIQSVKNALEKINVSFVLISRKADFSKADSIILPGVGSFGSAMQALNKKSLANPLKESVLSDKKPFLGICLGMQLLFESSEENPDVKGLNIFEGIVKKFTKAKRVPQIGWNSLQKTNLESRLLKGIPQKGDFYYINSYFVVPKNNNMVTAYSKYSEKFPAVLEFGNIFATQFHPEKSGNIGLKILENFSRF